MNLSNLFEKKKTSLDYLKEISEKQSAANDIAAQAERDKADAIVEAAREKTRATMLLKEREERAELSKRINELAFDTSNPQSMIAGLSYLGSLVDGWLGSNDSERAYRTLSRAAESKLKLGLAQLTHADPTNAMIPYFNGMLEGFVEKRRKLQKQHIIRLTIPWGLLVLDLLVMCIYGAVTDWEEVGSSLSGVGAFIFFFAGVIMLTRQHPIDRDDDDDD